MLKDTSTKTDKFSVLNIVYIVIISIYSYQCKNGQFSAHFFQTSRINEQIFAQFYTMIIFEYKMPPHIKVHEICYNSSIFFI